MGGGIEQDSGDELYGGQDKQGGEVCFDLIGGLGTSVSRLEVGKTAIVKEDEAEHPGKGIRDPLENWENPTISRSFLLITLTFGG
jgi:hypothetical protein